MNSVCSTMHLCISLSPMAVDIKSVKSCPKKVKRRLNLNAIQANAAGRFLVKCEVFSGKIFLKVYQTNKTSFEHKIWILIHLRFHGRYLESLLFQGLLKVENYFLKFKRFYFILSSLLITSLLKCLVKLWFYYYSIIVGIDR